MLALLQFDATNRPLVERMLAEGRMPALAELRRRGTWHALGRSTPLFVEAGSYVTLYSGTEVGDHGIYSAFLWSAPEQRVRFMDAFPAPTAVWDRLARAGGRSLAIDPYESWAASETEGVRLLNGWQYKHKFLLRISQPRGAQAALSLRLGRPRAVEGVYGRQSIANLRALRPRLLAAPGRAAEAVAHLLAREELDLVWVTFSAAHYAGHYYWDLARTTDDGLNAQARHDLERTMTDAYVATDAAIGRILEALPPGADVIVFSPIGMAPDASRSDLLPDMLRAVLDGGASRRREDGASNPGGGNAIWRLRARVPGNLRQSLARPVPGTVVRELTARLQLRGTDWGRTRAFALPGDHAGYIRFNLRGREAEGIVDPSEAGALADEIAAGLETFREPDGAPALEAIHHVAREVGGERAEQLPDMVVRWRSEPAAGLSGVSSAAFGDVPRRGVGSGRSGNHDTDAWAMIVPGASRLEDRGRDPRIADIAATACAAAGAEAAGIAGESLLAPSQ